MNLWDERGKGSQENHSDSPVIHCRRGRTVHEGPGPSSIALGNFESTCESSTTTVPQLFVLVASSTCPLGSAIVSRMAGQRAEE